MLILSPYIDKEQYAEAKQLASVSDEVTVPGMESYAGYLTVDRMINSNLWFWYFPARESPVGDAPLIIWLQGGPGASSLQGLFNEIGPFSIASDDNTIVEKKYSWGNNHSLLFIDNPIGTGYSFTDDPLGYATNQEAIGYQLYLAVKQFLKLFAELQPAPMVLVGQGYGAKHVASLAIQIHRHTNSSNPSINLQGIAIGNGLIDPSSLVEYSEFARQTGLLDSKVADDLHAEELFLMNTIIDGATMSSALHWEDVLGKFTKVSRLKNVFNYLDDLSPMGIYLNDAALPYERIVQGSKVREALHVGSTQFGPMKDVHEELKPDFMKSVKPWMEELLEHYRILCYSGQMDILVTYPMSVKIYESFHWSGRADYQRSERRPWYHNGQLAGYHKSAGKFTEVLVRNAGHMVSAAQPARALALISAFARGVGLDADTAAFSFLAESKETNGEQYFKTRADSNTVDDDLACD